MTETETKRRDHALHNEKVCKFLYEENKYQDWVITTAFYSALHFVRYKIFPLQIDGYTYNNFDIYFARNRDVGLSQHQHLIDLSKRYLPKKLRGGFSRLFSNCMHARYNDYLMEQEDVETSIVYLEQLKSFCNTNKGQVSKNVAANQKRTPRTRPRNRGFNPKTRK